MAVPSDSSSRLPDDASSPVSAEEQQNLLRSLRRKEGNWIAWGEACQQLQKLGYSQQQIFEETGFEPIQQNQIVVATQVYQSIASNGAKPAVLERFERTGSDSLYALRVLTQAERVAAATLMVEKNLDSEGAHEVARALKDFSRLPQPPAEFPDYPDDAVAHSYWSLARQQADLQLRSRLIAQGLRFASSETARQQIEKLLTDFTVLRRRSAPRLPFYRLESAEEQPRVLPVVGQLPLSAADLQAVPFAPAEGLFQIVKFAASGAWVALPGWQVVISAEDPVAILSTIEQIATPELDSTIDRTETVMLLVDRAKRSWDAESYFLVEQAGQLEINWYESAPAQVLGKVVLVLRAKKVLDEDFNQQLWQIDE